MHHKAPYMILCCPDSGTSKNEGHTEPADGFDYMQARDEKQHMEALAQEYLDKLLQESAPASYLPMLAGLVRASDLPLQIRVSSMFLKAL